VTEKMGTETTTWIRVDDATSLQEGEMVTVESGDVEIAVARVDGSYFAFDALCPHAYGYLADGSLEGFVVSCPLHRGLFDVRTGEVLGGEPQEQIATYAVRVEGSEVFVSPESGPAA
jgi:apoptosis-inducing factor 3